MFFIGNTYYGRDFAEISTVDFGFSAMPENGCCMYCCNKKRAKVYR